MLIANGAPAIGVVLLAALGAVGGVLVADRRLVTQGKSRQRRIGQQLPTVAELLAFAVAAGESPVVALERVAHTTTGDLSDEIRVAIADLHAGFTLDQALRGIADRTGSQDVERFVDGLIVSLERGTPLAEVLRAQAADARAADRRALMEIAGRKDVAMLIPVVFFILPTVVLIALFPGIRSLQLVVP
jgi:tight adherence protein C